MSQERCHRYPKAIAIETTKYRAYDESLRTTKGVIANKEIFLIERQMLLTSCAVADIKIFEGIVKET